MALDRRAMKMYHTFDGDRVFASLRASVATLAKWTPERHASFAAACASEGNATRSNDHAVGRVLLSYTLPHLQDALIACAEFVEVAAAYEVGGRSSPPTGRNLRSFDEFAMFLQPIVHILEDVRACQRTQVQHMFFKEALDRFAPRIAALAMSLPST